MPFSAPVLTYRAKGLASNIQSKVLKVHNTLININITAILAPEMTYTPGFKECFCICWVKRFANVFAFSCIFDRCRSYFVWLIEGVFLLRYVLLHKAISLLLQIYRIPVKMHLLSSVSPLSYMQKRKKKEKGFAAMKIKLTFAPL